MALTQTQVSQLYVAIFGRAAEGSGSTYWKTQDDMASAAENMLITDAAKDYFGETLDDNQLYIEHIYENTLGKTIADDPEGIAYWVSELDGGKSQAEVTADLINAAQLPENAGPAQDQFNNKVAVSDYAATTLEAITETTPFADFVGFIEDVDETAASVTAAMAEVDAEIPEPVEPAEPDQTLILTANQDILSGDTGDDTFFADVVQVGGPQVNSLATGDSLQGMGGADTLEAQVTEGLFMGGTNMSIQPRTNSIETVKLESLDSNMAGDVNSEVFVNAKNMDGVDAIWSWHSDANLTIQNMTTKDNSGNIRELSDMTVGMGYSGNDDTNWNESDFKVYFDQDYLNPETLLSNQVVSYRIMNEDAYDDDSAAPLAGVYVESMRFTLNGVQYDLADYLVDVEDPLGDGTEIQTYVELRDALISALDEMIIANPDITELADMEIALGGNFTSDNARVGTEITFSIPGLNAEGVENTLEVSPFFAEIRPSEGADVDNSNRYERSATQEASATQELRINVDLEKVGLAADGGDLVIGSMAKDGLNEWGLDTAANGIQIFDVTVYGDESKPSSLDELRSTNNTLREINVTTDAAQTDTYADLTIADLKDIKTFDATDFKGDLNITAALTDEIMDKYLELDDDAADYTADNDNFVYTGGVGDDTITLNIDGMPVAHEDFTLSVDSGAGDDTIITQIGFFNDTVFLEGDDQWEYGDHKALDNLSIETGGGDDEVHTVGDGDFFISTGSGNDTVYTNNDGAGVEALVNEVQTITFGTAGDLATQGNITVTLSNGTTFTTATINTGDDDTTVAQKVAAAINAQDGGINVVASQTDAQVELTYTNAYVNAQTDSNGDVANATVTGIVTDVTMNAAVITTAAAPGTAADIATTEIAVLDVSAIADGSATNTITIDGTVITLANTDGNLSVTPFEITEQIAASTFTNYTVTDSNPSLGTVEFTANTDGNVADLDTTIAVVGVAAPVMTDITQGVDAVDYVAGIAEVQTLTITNGADQSGTVTMGVDVDADGIIQADENFDIAVGYGNQVDVAADIAAGIDALSGVSATHAANTDDVVVTWDSDLLNPTAITMIDGAVRSANVNETIKGRVASSNDATWVLNAENTEIDDLNGRDASPDSILYNATVTVTLSGATFGSSGDDVTNGAANKANNGFEASAVIPTSEYLGNEYDVNQAIKDAIQNDSIMNMLLDVEDGPEATLIITSKVDGTVLSSDLAIDITGPSSLTVSELASLNVAYQDIMNNSTLNLTEAEMVAYIRANAAILDTIYDNPVLGTDEGVERAGNTSLSESDNVINLGSGDDLVVLGTDAQSNDTIQFTGSDIGTNAIFNFVADAASNSTDYLDLSAYLTNTASISGSATSATPIGGEYLFNATTLNENDVVFINDFAAGAGQSWANLTGESLKTALINTGNTDYGSIDDTDLDVSNANTTLVGSEIKNVIFVENDRNDGEYAVFEATSSAATDEFTSITRLGEVDFGNTITTMSHDDFEDNDGAEDDGSLLPAAPANISFAGQGVNTVIGTSGNDTFVVVGAVDNSDYATGATTGTSAAYFTAAVNAIENGQVGSDISSDIYEGGGGTDTMEIWGDVNFTAATLNNIEVFDIHSTVTFRSAQLEGTTVQAQDGSTVIVIDGDYAGTYDTENEIKDLQDLIDGVGGDTDAPTLVSVSPLDDAIDVAVDADIVLTFSEDVVAGTGAFRITNLTDDTAAPITITAATATFDGATVTLNPPTDLVAGDEYSVSMLATPVADAAGNNFAGIAAGSITFATAGAGETIINLADFAGGAYTADDEIAEVFQLDFSIVDGVANSADVVVEIIGFDATADVLRFDDAGDTPATVDEFLDAAVVASDGFAGETTVSFFASAPAEGSSITLVGITDATLGGATPFVEII